MTKKKLPIKKKFAGKIYNRTYENHSKKEGESIKRRIQSDPRYLVRMVKQPDGKYMIFQREKPKKDWNPTKLKHRLVKEFPKSRKTTRPEFLDEFKIKGYEYVVITGGLSKIEAQKNAYGWGKSGVINVKGKYYALVGLGELKKRGRLTAKKK